MKVSVCTKGQFFFPEKKKLEWSYIKLENFKQIRRSKSLETDGMHFI